MNFATRVTLALQSGKITPKDLVREFGASYPTVERWAKGINEPHPAMKSKILEFLEKFKMRILVLDDNEFRHECFAEHFKGNEVRHTWTVEECCHALTHLGPWDIVYLDHDLNDFKSRSTIEGMYGRIELTGFDVARFIARMDADKRPPEVIVHSWNPGGASMMVGTLRDAGIKCSYRMFNGCEKIVEEDSSHENGFEILTEKEK